MHKQQTFWKQASFCLLLILLCTITVSALGITPAQTIFNHKGVSTHEGTFTIINDAGKNLHVAVDVGGDLAKYVTLDQALVKFAPEDYEAVIHYSITPPNMGLQPGDNIVTFSITELPADTGQGSFVGARLQLLSNIIIRVPYPDKYALSELNVYDGDTGGNIVFVTTVDNRGSIPIQTATGTVEILGPRNDVITIFDTSTKQVAAGRREELMALWAANVNPGEYTATVTVDYDGKKTTTSTPFTIGGVNVEVRDIFVDPFTLGDIAQFHITLQNRQDQILTDVFTTIDMYDVHDVLIATFKTPHETLTALDDHTLLAYWDTTGITAGEYTARLTVHYNGKSVEREVETTITATGIKTRMRSTGRAIALSGFNYTFNSVFMIGIVILVLINICWFVYFKRKS